MTSAIITHWSARCRSPTVEYSTVGDRAFAVAGARLWNSLPPDIIASDTLSWFCHELKTFLFRQSYPTILL